MPASSDGDDADYDIDIDPDAIHLPPQDGYLLHDDPTIAAAQYSPGLHSPNLYSPIQLDSQPLTTPLSARFPPNTPHTTSSSTHNNSHSTTKNKGGGDGGDDQPRRRLQPRWSPTECAAVAIGKYQKISTDDILALIDACGNPPQPRTRQAMFNWWSEMASTRGGVKNPDKVLRALLREAQAKGDKEVLDLISELVPDFH